MKYEQEAMYQRIESDVSAKLPSGKKSKSHLICYLALIVYIRGAGERERQLEETTLDQS